MLLTYLVAIFALVSVNASTSSEKSQRIFEDQINNTLINIAADLPDPYILPEFTKEIQNDAITLKFSAKNLTVGGISKFVATKLKVGLLPPAVDMEVVFDKLEISAEYDLDMKASFVPIYGKGNLSLSAENIVINGSAKASFARLGISDLKFDFDLSTFDLNITGFLHNEQLSQIISSSTSQLFPDFVHKYGSILASALAKQVEGLINGALSRASARVELI